MLSQRLFRAYRFPRQPILKILVFIIIFLTVRWFSPLLSSFYNPEIHGFVHTILELCSIFISFFIFVQARLIFQHIHSRTLLLIGAAFFIIGALDSLHALTYKDMPAILVASSVQRATWFWVAARCTEALSLFIILWSKDTRASDRFKLSVYTGALLYVGIVSGVIILFTHRLPTLVVEGVGTTSLKNGLEYGISAIHLAIVALMVSRYRRSLDPALMHVLLASVMLVMSELLFTFYKSVHDLDNFLGHVYKVIGYYYLMKGFYFSKIKEAFIRKQRIQKEFTRVLQKHQGVLFEFVKTGERFIHTFCDGPLLPLLNLSPNKVIGYEVYDFLPAPKCDRLAAYYEKAWRGEDQLFEFEMEHQLYMLISLKPVVEHSAVVEVIGTCINISQFKQAELKLNNCESQMQKLQAVSQLAASISHEVRNPLTVTRGFLQLLLSSGITDTQKKYVEMSLLELDRAGGIITDYLNFAKPDIENAGLLNVEEEMKHIISFLTPFAHMQSVEVRHSYSGNTYIYGDRNKFRQSILNLGKNGIEAMPEGGTLTIQVFQDPDHVTIQIVDTGTGMDREQIQRLGTPYFSTKEKGTGLGMTVVYGIIKAMNGQIHVDSEQGIGTTFHLRFPNREPISHSR